MMTALRTAIVPFYILLCIMLGGSAQGMWGNMALQLIGIGIIAWTLLDANSLRVPKPAKSLFAIAGAAVALVVVQLIPLPPGLWQALPGREPIAEGFVLLGQKAPWLPLSLAPYETMVAAMSLIPPLAVLSGMLIARAFRPGWLVLAILAGTLAAVLLGALQVSSASPMQSPWYLYRRTNHGVAVGFFANSNHMATLLVVSLAFLAAFLAALRARVKHEKAGSAVLLLAVAGSLTLIVGIALNGSLAALLLGLPVAAVSVAMFLPQSRRLSFPVAAMALVSVVAVAVVYMSPLQDRLAASNATSFESRGKFWSNGVSAIGDHGLVGSGLGSFPDLYPRYEDQAAVTRTFVNHAHNDYLEIALETGISGIALLIGFFAWWIRRASVIWRSAVADRFAQAATIASAAILVHSLVDYPLRTAALSAIFAGCLALMVQTRIRDPKHAADLWPTRHLAG